MLEFSDIQLLLDRIFMPEYFLLKWWPKLNDTVYIFCYLITMTWTKKQMNEYTYFKNYFWHIQTK